MSPGLFALHSEMSGSVWYTVLSLYSSLDIGICGQYHVIPCTGRGRWCLGLTTCPPSQSCGRYSPERQLRRRLPSRSLMVGVTSNDSAHIEEGSGWPLTPTPAELDESSVEHMLHLIHPQLEAQLMLAKNVQLIEGLQEIQIHEQDVSSCLSPQCHFILGTLLHTEL